MKIGAHKKKVVWAGLCALIAVVAVIAFWPGEPEPKFKGKKLSYWLKFYDKRRTGELTLAELAEMAEVPHAMRQIGSSLPGP